MTTIEQLVDPVPSALDKSVATAPQAAPAAHAPTADHASEAPAGTGSELLYGFFGNAADVTSLKMGVALGFALVAAMAALCWALDLRMLAGPGV